MSVERALINRAQPFVVAARLRELISEEIGKGCRPDLSLCPVSLEPCYQPIGSNASLGGLQPQPMWTQEQPPSPTELVRTRIWISPEQAFDWKRAERFIKQLQTASYRIGFEIAGNDMGVSLGFVLQSPDLPLVRAAFQGEFDYCELTEDASGPLSGLSPDSWDDLLLADYYPPPPYSHLLTRPEEVKVSTFEPLIVALAKIRPPAVGLCQVLFQPVPPEHDWHRNIQVLLDLEYALKLQDWFQTSQRFAQQTPSGDLRQMSYEVENKAHNDKPLFSMALRLAVIGAAGEAWAYMLSLSSFTGLFQHGGRPLERMSERTYRGLLTVEQIRDMLLGAYAHRPGFIVNSWELTGLVHVPPLAIGQHRRIVMDSLETLPVRTTLLHVGTLIGYCDYAGCALPVYLPDEQRARHTHIIGRPGSGKTSTQEHMIVQDIEEGHGVAVLDPHGDLVERLLCLIPERHLDRTIYFNPGDPDWIPIWNPFERIPGQDIGRMADDLVLAIKSFVSSGGWGDRLEHLLRNMIFGLIHLPHSTFLDLSNLLRPNTEESKRLAAEIVKHLDNESAIGFWKHDYLKYSKDDLGPPRNKLSKLLLSGPVALMLSQPESSFSFRRIMDQGQVLLVNLSSVGGSLRGVIGSFILSLLHLSALSRSDRPKEERKQFHIHCDEAHLIMTDTIEDMIAETRKYGVSLSLAHQFMSQFGQSKVDAFSSVGETLIFNVDSKDARYLTKDLQDLVAMEDLTSLGMGEAIARIGTEIVRVRTLKPLAIPEHHFKDRIIETSRARYYRPAPEIRKWIRRRSDRWLVPFRSLTAECQVAGPPNPEDFHYDEF